MRDGKEVASREIRQIGTGFALKMQWIRRLGAFYYGGAADFARM
jgi:hypothetical protein